MSKAQETPRMWAAGHGNQQADGSRYWAVLADDPERPGDSVVIAEGLTKKLATLFAAAPKLRTALELIDLAPLSHGDQAIEEMQRLARAAIALTRGDTE